MKMRRTESNIKDPKVGSYTIVNESFPWLIYHLVLINLNGKMSFYFSLTFNC